MTESEFGGFMRLLEDSPFDSEKVDVVRTASKTKWFNTGQVNSILDAIYFESSKMEAARLLYDHTVDQENYYTLAGAFNFSSYKRELNDFIIQASNR